MKLNDEPQPGCNKKIELIKANRTAHHIRELNIKRHGEQRLSLKTEISTSRNA
jgi:hypothetical protein